MNQINPTSNSNKALAALKTCALAAAFFSPMSLDAADVSVPPAAAPVSPADTASEFAGAASFLRWNWPLNSRVAAYGNTLSEEQQRELKDFMTQHRDWMVLVIEDPHQREVRSDHQDAANFLLEEIKSLSSFNANDATLIILTKDGGSSVHTTLVHPRGHSAAPYERIIEDAAARGDIVQGIRRTITEIENVDFHDDVNCLAYSVIGAMIFVDLLSYVQTRKNRH